MSPAARVPRVAIVGGGPAGAVAALVLARRGLEAVVLEAGSGPQAKVGECLPPTVAPLLSRLGLRDALVGEGGAGGAHLPSYGNRSVWGAERAVDRDFLFSVHGVGWHLDRRRFEEQLAEAAVEAGVDWRYGHRLRSVEKQGPTAATGGAWHLALTAGGRETSLAADFVIDASGRKACFSRRLGVGRVRHDRLVGITATFKDAPGAHPSADSFTLVEAVENGWWYSAPLGGGRLAVAFQTDGDLLDRSLRREAGFRAALSRTAATRQRLAERGFETTTAWSAFSPRIQPADSSRLTAVAGDGWLAAGDAAAAYDPLSSYGIGSAMGSGFYAAQAAFDSLAGSTDAPLAYTSLLDRVYAQYQELKQQHYALEGRWPQSPFWARRQQRPAGSDGGR